MLCAQKFSFASYIKRNLIRFKSICNIINDISEIYETASQSFFIYYN